MIDTRIRSPGVFDAPCCLVGMFRSVLLLASLEEEKWRCVVVSQSLEQTSRPLLKEVKKGITEARNDHSTEGGLLFVRSDSCETMSHICPLGFVGCNRSAILTEVGTS
jgi:hypothetical protein